jgi:MFS family permease
VQLAGAKRVSDWLKRAWDALGLNRMVIALSFARMADAIGNSLLFVVIPLYVKKQATIDIPLPILVGLLISGYGFSAAILQPFMGSFSDRFGHNKRFIQLGLLLLGGATLAFIWAQSFVTMLILRMVQGAGLAMEIPSTMTMMTVATRHETRGGAMGVYTTFRMVGLAVGPVVGGFLHDYIGFTWTYIIAAAVLFLAVIIVQFAIEAGQTIKKTGKKKTSFLSMINPPILSATFATVVMAASFTLISTLENEFNERLRIGAFEFGVAFSALMLGRLIFQIPLGHSSDKHGRKPFILCGLILLAPATAVLGVVTDIWEFSGARFVQGVASASIISPALAFASDMSKKGGEGRQTSVVTMGFAAGIAIGPLIAAFLSLVFFEFPFLVMAGLIAISGIIIAIFMPRQAPQQEDEADEDEGNEE